MDAELTERRGDWEIWHVHGGFHGQRVHTVRVNVCDPDLSRCDCQGYRYFGRWCAHLDEVQSEIEAT